MKHQCHNVLLLMGNAESIAAIKQSLLLEPTSSKPVMDFSLLLPPPQTLQQAKRNHALYSSSSVGALITGVRPVMAY